ncbi:MAG TPA: CHASE2 domain-containing protein [Tepidisphaeraceae bacterium]|jgi:class 3 adenylate cyclase|nr:CHASE2 domain-containing protein [Tepidisphaeraceae bacterium]
MFARARKTFKDGAVYGILLTLLVTGFYLLGLLDPLEHWFYDQRIRYCQFFTPPPSDRLVYLDIDDAAMDSIGAWAWPRSTLAEMVDEIHLAGPKALAFDVIFPDPQPVRYIPQENGTFKAVDDDKIFADSLKKLGCALLPIAFSTDAPQSPSALDRALHELLLHDLELTEANIPALLVKRGVTENQLKESKGHAFINAFLQARQDAMHERIMAELSRHPLSEPALRAVLLPHTDPDVQSAAVRLLHEQYMQATAELAMQQLSDPLPSGIPPLLHAPADISPTAILAETARATGFVNNPKTTGTEVVRRLPLFMEHNGRAYPQVGLALAAMTLDADLTHCTFTESRISVPRADGSPIDIPVYQPWSDTLKQPLPTMFDIPWFGKYGQWEDMYDKVGGAHLSLNVVWSACQTRHRIRQNNQQADDALRAMYELYAPEKLKPFNQSVLPLDDPSVRLPLIESVLDDFAPFIEAFEKTNLAEIKDPVERENDRKMMAQGPALRHVLAENPKLQAQLAVQRQFLKQRLHGRAILIGWTSTASTFDEVPTPLYQRCPGVVVHGTIFNAIMTRFSWRLVPWWVNATLIIVMGLLTTLIATRTLPYRALLAALLLLGAYLPINGILIFDYGRHIATLAGPVVVVAVVWAACTLVRLLNETWERARITHRFQSYVDPALVQYVIDHPEVVRLEGEVRETTICFTDLVGFTTMTERLREKAVKILGRYMALMVPAIRNHNGFVHRFMGDGIMFSYGALIPNPDMAIDAVTTILEMQEVLGKFNEELKAEGNPTLAIRAGVNTGMVVVGDSGAADAAEYACLGHGTNLAARLESACSAFGIHTLISFRTVELLQGKFLLRPIARLIVKGSARAVMVFEPLARVESATASQIRLTDLTADVFDNFLAGQFAECVAASHRLEEAFGPSKLAVLYRQTCCAHLADSPAEFQGCVALKEK